MMPQGHLFFGVRTILFCSVFSKDNTETDLETAEPELNPFSSQPCIPRYWLKHEESGDGVQILKWTLTTAHSYWHKQTLQGEKVAFKVKKRRKKRLPIWPDPQKDDASTFHKTDNYAW